MVDGRDRALQVKWLWAMAAWYDNLQMTLTGLVRLLSPLVLFKMRFPNGQDMTCAAGVVHILSSGMHTVHVGPCVSGCPAARCTGQA